jgi:N-acetyltransferase
MNDLSQAPFAPLEGRHLWVRELTEADTDPLFDVLYDPETWVVKVRGIDTREKFGAYLAAFREKRRSGQQVPVVAVDRATGSLAALSVYHNAAPGLTKVEIGFTWVAPRFQRTHVNTELKLLMMTHAFERWQVKRVEFYVDPRNDKSNRAMARVGATLEGCLRKVRFLNATDPGDRNIYSVLDTEWPRCKAGLEDKLRLRG